MKGEIAAVAGAILDRTGYQGALHPLLAARAAGLSVWAVEGLAVPAKIEGNCVYFDEDHNGWREVVGSLACGFALRVAGIDDTPENRRLLATALRTLVAEDGAVEPFYELESARVLH